MKKLILFLLLLTTVWAWGCKPEEPPTPPPPVVEGPKKVEKTNPMKLYVHYMPWFHSKEISGYWGSHWTMANKLPDRILPNGQREIAAHYYPLIGPYDSGDPDLVDYHVLLMKYAGIDGVLIDWYGSHDVADYGSNRDNANELIKGIKATGLDFAIVYEDFTAEEVANSKGITPIDAARQDMSYAIRTFLSSDNYIEIEETPLMLTFGPRLFTSKGEWDQILSVFGKAPALLPLWGFTSKVGAENAAGEFSWVDFTPGLSELSGFYQSAPAGNITMGSAYPGFHDFYVEGGWGNSYGYVNHQNGQTFSNTLDKAQAFNLPRLQLVTWNDFGEGTMLEPTAEFQYLFLEKLQAFAGVSYAKDALETIHTYYLKRKEYQGNAQAQQTLDEVFDALNDLELNTAKQLLSSL